MPAEQGSSVARRLLVEEVIGGARVAPAWVLSSLELLAELNTQFRRRPHRALLAPPPEWLLEARSSGVNGAVAVRRRGSDFLVRPDASQPLRRGVVVLERQRLAPVQIGRRVPAPV